MSHELTGRDSYNMNSNLLLYIRSERYATVAKRNRYESICMGQRGTVSSGTLQNYGELLWKLCKVILSWLEASIMVEENASGLQGDSQVPKSNSGLVRSIFASLSFTKWSTS